MRTYFTHIENGDNARVGRQHRLRMLHKKQVTTSNTPHLFVPVPPSTQRTYDIDPETLAHSISKYKLKTVPIKPSKPRGSTAHGRNNTSSKSMPPNNQNCSSVLPGQEKTDLIMKSMRMYFRTMPPPHLFDPVKNYDDLNDKTQTKKTKENHSLGRKAGVARFVSRFHKKIRKKQLINRYSTAKYLTADEYGALQTRSTQFFQIEEHSTKRFQSELVMRFLTEKTNLSGLARDGLHELIDQKDPVAMYTLHIYMNDNKMLNRFFKTTQRRLEDKKKALLKKESERIIKPPVFDGDVESAIYNLLS